MDGKIDHPPACTRCGACVAACPVERVGGHALVTFLADPEAAEWSAWLCTSCRRCQEVCPQGIDIYALIMAQRRRESPPAGYQAAIEAALACGEALQVSQQALDQMRARWGLEAVALPANDVLRKLLGE